MSVTRQAVRPMGMKKRNHMHLMSTITHIADELGLGSYRNECIYRMCTEEHRLKVSREDDDVGDADRVCSLVVAQEGGKVIGRGPSRRVGRMPWRRDVCWCGVGVSVCCGRNAEGTGPVSQQEGEGACASETGSRRGAQPLFC